MVTILFLSFKVTTICLTYDIETLLSVKYDFYYSL